MRRLPWLFPVAVTAALATASAPGALADAASTRVAVLGDSYVSGEGLPSAAGDCGRTEDAWGVALGRALGDPDPQSAACTGATVADVTIGDGGTQAQVATVEGQVDVAVLVVGGNDLGFAELVAGCLDLDQQVDRAAFDSAARSTAWQDLVGSDRRALGCDAEPGDLLTTLASFESEPLLPLPGGDRGTLAEVYVAVADAVLAPAGTLLVATYPALFHPSDGWAQRYGRRCHGVLAADADSFVEVTGALRDTIVGAAATAADRLAGRASVVVVDVHALAGGDGVATVGGAHGLCGPGEEWLNGLTLVEGGLDVTTLAGALLGGGVGDLDLATLGARPTASFHPNTAGHAGIATAAAEALAGPDGAAAGGDDG